MRKILVILGFLVSIVYAKDLAIPTLNNNNMPVNVSINDKSIIFHDYPNKYIVLEFFGYGCPTCRHEIANLKSMQKGNPEIQVVSVHMNDLDDEGMNDFIFEYGINYPVVNFKYSYDLYQYAKKVDPDWEDMIPFMVIIDKDGKFLTSFMGMITEDEILEGIKKVKRLGN